MTQEFGWTAADVAEALLADDAKQECPVLVEGRDGCLVPIAVVQHLTLANGVCVVALRTGVGAVEDGLCTVLANDVLLGCPANGGGPHDTLGPARNAPDMSHGGVTCSRCGRFSFEAFHGERKA